MFIVIVVCCCTQARNKQIRLVFPAPSTEEANILRRIRLKIDEKRLADVMRNLLSNAVKFTPRGECVTVKTEVVVGSVMAPVPALSDVGLSGTFLRISITDSGAGISQVPTHSCF